MTSDEVGDPQDLGMWLDLNGMRMRIGNTKTVIFGCAAIVSYLSRFVTLMPGVGMGKKPDPIYLLRATS